MARIDIKSEREFLREIYKKVEAGKYGIPAFQRNYVWPNDRVADFFDSIWKGYPIGAVILWKPDVKMQTKDILTDEQQKDNNVEYYVLDGRQRLTTFYGCVQSNRERSPKFDLYFNLETEVFSFNAKADVLNIKVADVYDTYTLLMRLQDITKKYTDQPSLAKRYIETANKLNSVLQGYTVSEIFIEDCSLLEAEEVFDRINSKGTDISKENKLQAYIYRPGRKLVSDIIAEIKAELKPYHFDTIKNEYIIDCFYKFAGRNYYDSKIEHLYGFDLEGNLSQIKRCIRKSVEFLYNDCYVLSDKLLPYKNQLIAFTWFFMQNEGEISNSTRDELKKWFFYTSYNRTFTNSSLSNIRPIFNQFEAFIEGKDSYPIDYQKVEIPSKLNLKFKISDAQVDFIILSIIHHRVKNYGETNLQYKNYLKLPDDHITDYIFCFTDQDKQDIDNVLNHGLELDNHELSRFILSEDIVRAYRTGDKSDFRQLRQMLTLYVEKNLLKDNGIEYIEAR